MDGDVLGKRASFDVGFIERDVIGLDGKSNVSLVEDGKLEVIENAESGARAVMTRFPIDFVSIERGGGALLDEVFENPSRARDDGAGVELTAPNKPELAVLGPGFGEFPRAES